MRHVLQKEGIGVQTDRRTDILIIYLSVDISNTYVRHTWGFTDRKLGVILHGSEVDSFSCYLHMQVTHILHLVIKTRKILLLQEDFAAWKLRDFAAVKVIKCCEYEGDFIANHNIYAEYAKISVYFRKKQRKSFDQLRNQNAANLVILPRLRNQNAAELNFYEKKRWFGSNLISTFVYKYTVRDHVRKW